MADTTERDWKQAWTERSRRVAALTKQRRALVKHLLRVGNIATDEILTRVQRIRSERHRLLYLETGEADRTAEFAIGSAIFQLIRDDVPWLCDVITGELGIEPDQVLDHVFGNTSQRMPAGGGT